MHIGIISFRYVYLCIYGQTHSPVAVLCRTTDIDNHKYSSRKLVSSHHPKASVDTIADSKHNKPKFIQRVVAVVLEVLFAFHLTAPYRISSVITIKKGYITIHSCKL